MSLNAPMENYDLSSLNSSQLKEAVAILEELGRREAQRRLYSLYPEEGPLRRALYTKHTEFFAAGSEYRERMLMAANRCITPWTVLEMGNATRQIGELLGETAFSVRSWDGGSRCSKPAHDVFLKSISPAFRVHLDNGEGFDCTYKHRVLTHEGWISLDRLIRLSSGLRFRRGVGDLTASCDMEHCRGDRPPHPLGDSDRALFPLATDAQRLGQTSWLAGEGGTRDGHSHVSQGIDHCSMTDDPDQIAALCEMFPNPDGNSVVGWWSGVLRDAQQWTLEYAQQRSFGELHDRPLCELTASDAPGSFAAGETLVLCQATLQGEPLLASWSHPGRGVPGFQEASAGMEMFATFDHPPLAGGEKIIGIVPLGLQPILDLTVDDTHCYDAGGVYHHNTGKTIAGGYEMTLHLTGEYPEWWTGRRFERAVSGWAAGDTNETTRDIIQATLLGPIEEIGTGLIPGEKILGTTARAGVPDAKQSVTVQHVSGGRSQLGLKSYDQKRKSFQGTAKHVVWLDEEPPLDVYSECLVRTMTTDGLMLLTFTPLLGISDVVKLFLEGGKVPGDESLS